MRHLAAEMQLQLALIRQPLQFWKTWDRKTADHKSQISYLRAQVNQLLRFYLATEVKFHVELPVKLATYKAIPASGRR